jgi:hypothetical protein
MAALSVLRSYVRDELGELTAGRWSDTQLNSWLNRSVNYLVDEFKRGKCYELLRPNIKYVEYTLDVDYTEYTMWDVINNETLSKAETNTNTWYGYIHGMIGNYPLHVADAEEYHRLTATYGELRPSSTCPYIYFSGYDRTTKYLAFTSGYEPEQDGVLIGETSEAKARVAIDIPQASGAWGTTAAGYYYIYGDSGTFEEEILSYRAPGSTATQTTFASIAAAAVAESHNNCPTFKLFPTLTTADTLKVWFINKPTAMSAATDYPDAPYDCDNLMIWWTAAQAWQADRNFDMSDRLMAKFDRELAKKIEDYRQTTFNWLS